MRVFIIDDEPVARRVLRDRCAAESDLEVTGEYPDAESALTAIAERPPDLIFLDIKMGSMSGLQLARALDSGAAPLIVFTTAFDQHAVEAFEVDAVDYLLKPFDQSRFQAMLRRIRELFAKRSSDPGDGALGTLERLAQAMTERRPRLLAESGGQLRLVDAAHIEMVLADRNYVMLTAGQDTLHARGTLAQAEAAMRSQPMLQINRSCLINLNHVRRVSRSARGDYVFVLSGGATVSSSERFRHRVRLGIEQPSVDAGRKRRTWRCAEW